VIHDFTKGERSLVMSPANDVASDLTSGTCMAFGLLKIRYIGNLGTFAFF